MQRGFIFLACFLICAPVSAQLAASAGQYPFVYYTPKQGLVNSRVRNIMQDSKGRMLFVTYGGLSIYDGTRFVNYGEQDGLANELVNDVVEITPDSFVIATNVRKLNTLAHGRIGLLKTTDQFYPTVNHFLKASDGNLYVAADEGLFLLRGKKFFHLPLLNQDGSDVGRNFDKILEWRNYLFLIPWSAIKERLIVYDKEGKNTFIISTDNRIQDIIKDKQNRLWVTFTEGIKLLDTIALLNGKINYLKPPPEYSLVSHLNSSSAFFDNNNDLWLNSAGQLRLFSLNSSERLISIGKDLSTFTLTSIFQDREGTIWISTDGNGVIKIAGIHVQLLNGFLRGHPGFVSIIQQQHDTLWFFSVADHSIVRSAKNEIRIFPLRLEKMNIGSMHLVGKSLYLLGTKRIIWIPDKNDINSYRHPQTILVDSLTVFGAGLVDPNGAIITHAIVDSSCYLFVIRQNKILTKYKLDFMGDQPALDKSGRLWVITRNNQLLVFTLHPENPSQYLELAKDFTKQVPKMNLRSIAIDKNNLVWTGTRNSGLYCLKFDDLTFRSARQFTTKNGLTDNFINYLNCDQDNLIWVGTETGLDKLFLKDDRYVIGNISKSNNFFQTILRIVTTSDSTAWALTNEGAILKISNRSAASSLPSPPSVLAFLKVNGQPQTVLSSKFSYWQNNLTFYVAAPSFIDEKSIMYRYVLNGSGNDEWSEPSNNSVFNFINLPPGKYQFQVRTDFPESMYPSQYFSYPFIVRPPWWKTWWFRIPAALLLAGLLIFSFRSYYQRKLEKQQAILEKRQAVEEERTRIATDMHDDLGAGLSRIKFLSEMIGIKKQQQQPIEEDISKIRQYSHEMIDKMGEIVWALNQKNDSLTDLLSYTRSYAVEYLSQNGVECNVNTPDNVSPVFVSGEFRRNIFLAVKEALHNVVKHARADEVALTIDVNKNLTISIQDNGVGFDKNNVRPYSNGLQNIEKRMKDINGFADIQNNAGTTVILSAPL